MPSVAELVNAVRAGSREAFAELVERHKRMVVSLAYGYVGGIEEAEELAQEAFVRAYSGLQSLERPEKFASWLGGITAHVCIDRLRKRKRRHVSLEDVEEPGEPGEPGEPLDAAASSERARNISRSFRGALAELSPECRECAVMRFLGEMNYSEIARAQNVPTSTVRGRLYRATRLLRERLRKFWTEE